MMHHVAVRFSSCRLKVVTMVMVARDILTIQVKVVAVGVKMVMIMVMRV